MPRSRSVAAEVAQPFVPHKVKAPAQAPVGALGRAQVGQGGGVLVKLRREVVLFWGGGGGRSVLAADKIESQNCFHNSPLIYT